MSKKKSIAVAAILAVVLLIGGLLAYFTDRDTKTNVFTLGDNIEISLTETWDPEDGLGLHPGAVVTKAPSIKNDSTTTPAYVFAEVKVPCYDSTGEYHGYDWRPLYTFEANEGWTLIDTQQYIGSITYVYAYGSSSAMTSLVAGTTTSTPVFSEVTLEPSLTAEQKTTLHKTPDIIVNAYGVQTDNLDETIPYNIYKELFAPQPSI